jgi:hypothetical protein
MPEHQRVAFIDLMPRYGRHHPDRASPGNPLRGLTVTVTSTALRIYDVCSRMLQLNPV